MKVEVVESESNINSEHDREHITLVEKGEDVITARITIRCPYCSYKRKFTNKFSPSNMELVTVTFKIIDWLTCEKCDHQLNFLLDLFI